MHDLTVILVLLGAVVALAILARRVAAPYPILLVFGGLALGFAPGLPAVRLEPDVVFLLFLPPLLYSSAFYMPRRDFRANLRVIGSLALGLVLLTMAVVALVAHTWLPGFDWPAAFTLGAIVSPTDAIAATAIAQRLGVPRRIVTVLEGESLINDASGLVAYRYAAGVAVGGAFSLWSVGAQFAVVGAGGVAVGWAVGLATAWLRRKLDDPPVEVVIALLSPFVAYLPAEALGLSGVLAAVAAGFVIGRRGPLIMGAEARLVDRAVWDVFVFLLNGLAFILIGLQLPHIVDDLRVDSWPRLLGQAALVSAAVVGARLAWVFPATYLPRVLGSRRDDSPPDWREVVVLGWSGMRGVVSLGAALALPFVTDAGMPFPQRDLIVFLTFAVIFATLVAQGLSLPALIRGLGLRGDDGLARETAMARRAAAEAALERIAQLAAAPDAPDAALASLRRRYAHRLEHLDELPEGDPGAHELEHERVLLDVLDAERRAILALRDDGVINDAAMRRVEYDLDLEQARVET